MYEYVASGFAAAVVWALRLEGRVNTQEKVQEQRHIDLKELIEEKFDGMDKRLGRIERAMNGSLKHE